MTSVFDCTRFLGLSALVWLGLAPVATHAQCDESQSTLIVEVLTDNYPGETSWEVVMDGEVVLSGGPYSDGGTLHADTLCFASEEEPCIQFEIFDSYGDGICCGYGEGVYNVSLDGQIVASGGDFGSSGGALFACAPGETCNDAIPLTSADYGSVASPGDSYWSFQVQWHVHFTGGNDDTRLYIYDYANELRRHQRGVDLLRRQPGRMRRRGPVDGAARRGVTYWVRWASFDGPCTRPGHGSLTCRSTDRMHGSRSLQLQPDGWRQRRACILAIPTAPVPT